VLAYYWCWLLFAVWIVWCCHSGSCYYWKKCSNCESHLFSLRIRQLFNYVVYIIFLVSWSAKIGYAANSSPEVRHVSFMSHLKKICGLHIHQICGRNMWKYDTALLKTNYPISLRRSPDTWMVPFCWQSDGRGNET